MGATGTTRQTVTYLGQPYEITWSGTANDTSEPMVEIRPTGRRTGYTQTVRACDVDCAHGYRLTDSCSVCP